MDVRVDIGECRCPGTPHPGDAVFLHPSVTIPIGQAAFSALDGMTTGAEYQGILAQIYLHFGITGWTFTDAEGVSVPVTSANIDERLTWAHGGHTVAQRADELYSADVFAPLAARLSMSSGGGPKGPSTSATLPSGSKRPKHSRPSSPNGSAGRPSVAPALSPGARPI